MNYALAVTNPQRKDSPYAPQRVPQKSTNNKLMSGIIKKSPSKVDDIEPNEGLSPIVTFELVFPSISKKGGEDINVETEIERVSVNGLEQKQNKINDFALYLLSNCMDENFEIKGGFRIVGEEIDEAIYQYEIYSLTQALGLIYAVNEMLKSERETISIPINQRMEIELIRVGNLVRVKNSYNDDSPAWFKFDELALEIRKSGKDYVKVAQAIEDCIDRKESIIVDSSRKDILKKKRDIISHQFQINNFISSLKHMKELFINTDISSIRDNFQRDKLKRDEFKRRIIEENRDMMTMAIDAAPDGFLDMNIDHIGVEREEMEKKEEKLPPKEKMKKKSKAEKRKEQEQNFDNDEMFQRVPPVAPIQEQFNNDYRNLTSKNIYDLGEISQENIFKISEEERVVKAENVQKGRSSQIKKNVREKNRAPQQRETQSRQQQKSKKEKKNKNIEKSKIDTAKTPIIRKETAEFIVILLGTLVILFLLYYSYQANLL